MNELALATLRQKIVAEAVRFEVPALVDALLLLGYRESEIRFRSHPSLNHAAALVQSVEFEKQPRRAIVLVNIGLLSSQGPLPMYFWDLLLDERDATMSEFLWFFDQSILDQLFSAQLPERDAASLPDWPATRRLLLMLLRLGSPSGVQWLLSAYFPELDVEVRRVTGTRRLRTPDFEIGLSELGTGCSMGGITELPVGGVEARLICEEETDKDAAAWIEEAQRRLKRLALPILVEQDPYLFLRVYLVLRRPSDFFSLRRDRYMGVNRLYSSGGSDEPFEQLLLWSGEVRQAAAVEQMNFVLPSARRGQSARKE